MTSISPHPYTHTEMISSHPYTHNQVTSSYPYTQTQLTRNVRGPHGSYYYKLNPKVALVIGILFTLVFFGFLIFIIINVNKSQNEFEQRSQEFDKEWKQSSLDFERRKQELFGNKW